MKRILAVACSATLALAGLALGAGTTAAQKSTGATAAGAAKPKKLVIGMIAKSNTNPVFQAARVGAEDAAKDLGAKYGMNIKIDWRTPNEEDAQKQANAIEELTNIGTNGIAISCSDATMVTSSINAAVARGVPVVCFDSDAPQSKRFAFHGINDIECGKQLMDELAKVMGGKGVIAVLAGNQNAPNLQKRVEGVKEAMKKYPGITLKEVYYHKETAQDATAKVEEVQNTHPDITGWAMVGGWPLFTDTMLKWKPGKVKIVAVDALPAQLPYIEKGVASTLMAQQVYNWGYRSVELLVDKIINNKLPTNVFDYSQLLPVTKENVVAFGENWKKWLPQK